MIPEEARLEIVRKKNLGETWTGIARWLEDEHGIKVHRTTVQRWYDREVYLDEEIDDEFSTEDRVKLDKKIETYKAESRFWKKLYETAIKDSTKKELVEFVEQLNTKQFQDVQAFYDTMPRLKHEIEVKNPKTKKVNRMVLSGLNDFFA